MKISIEWVGQILYSGAAYHRVFLLYLVATTPCLAAPLVPAQSQAISAMPTAAAGPTVTTLGNGRALIYGGWNSSTSGATAVCYKYDITNGWTPLSGCIARSGHTAESIPDALGDVGHVLLYGGANPNADGSPVFAQLYADDDNSTFISLPLGGMGPIPDQTVKWHASSFLGVRQEVLISGGAKQSSDGTWTAQDSVFLFEFRDLGFRQLPSLKHARWGHTSTLLSDGSVLVTGGTSDGVNVLNTAEVFNPTTESWTEVLNTMVSPRIWHTGTLPRLYDGGTPSYPSAYPSGVVVFTGGLTVSGSPPSSSVLNTAEFYDPIQRKFFPLPTYSYPSSRPTVVPSLTSPLSSPREHHSATLVTVPTFVVEGRQSVVSAILLSGGDNGNTALSSSDLLYLQYNATTGLSGVLANTVQMASARTYASAAALNPPNASSVLIAGGSSTLSTQGFAAPMGAGTTPINNAEIFSLVQPHGLIALAIKNKDNVSQTLVPSPVFSPGTYSYSVVLPSSISGVEIDTSVQSLSGDTTTLKVEGGTAVQGSSSAAWIVTPTSDPFPTTITITVSPPVGTPSSIGTKSYVIKLERPKTNLTTFSSLTLNGNNPLPAATPKTFTYSTSNAAPIALFVSATDPRETMTVGFDGKTQPLISGLTLYLPTQGLKVSPEVYPVTVSIHSSDGTATAVYTIRVALRSSLSLLNLSIETLVGGTDKNAGWISPTEYHWNHPQKLGSNTTIVIKPTPSIGATMQVTFGGKPVVLSKEGDYRVSLTPGSAPNVITIKVTAQDTIHSTQYTIDAYLQKK